MTDLKTEDKYVKEVIKTGDEISDILARIFEPTQKYNKHVSVIDRGMNGLNIVEVPKGYCIGVISAGGNPKISDPSDYAQSSVDELIRQSYNLGFEPIAMADIIDMRSADKSLAEVIALSIAEEAKQNGISVINGEYAVLGNRVRDANVSAAMIGKIRKEDADIFHGKRYGTSFAIFDPNEDPVIMNCDGVGTKTRFYEMLRKYHLPIRDFYAMVFDDAVKKDAKVEVVSGVVETRGDIPFPEIDEYACNVAKSLEALGIMEHEAVGDRIMGNSPGEPSLNIGGTVVSTIKRNRIENPLKPSAGEDIIVVRGKPNTRSNGITSKSEGMEILGQQWCEKYGVTDWTNTAEGRIFLEYFTEPSVILYPIFKDLIRSGLATSVYHPSGGAYDGKFAKPIAKQGLSAHLKNPFPPDWREITISCALGKTAENAYRQWNMGMDGLFMTTKPLKAMEAVRAYGLEVRLAGKVKKEKSKTGATIRTFKLKDVPKGFLSRICEDYVLQTFEGREIHYSGKN